MIKKKRFRPQKNSILSSQKWENIENGMKEDTSPKHHTQHQLETIVTNVSKTYAKHKKNSALKNSIFFIVLFVLLLTSVAWTLPRVLSFRFDSFGSLISELNPRELLVPENTELNVLALGVGGNENAAPNLTDSITYIHYDGKDPASVTTISIPRDLFVNSPTLGKVKINSIYTLNRKTLWEAAAFQQLMDIVWTIVGKEITQYVLIDFDGFRRLIDAVGGIDIDVPERLYDAAYPTRNWGYTVVDIPVGLQHFDGDKALKYARSRHSTSDFDRSKRQQLVLGALQAKMLSAKILTSPRKIEGIYSVLSDSIKTNASLTDMVKMAKKAAAFNRENLTGHILDESCFDALRLCHPGGLMYGPSRDLFGGASVVLPRWASYANLSVYSDIKTFAHIVTTYPELTKAQPLAIVNASGRTNLAYSTALRLRSLGFPVDETQLKNAPEKVEKTYLRYNSSFIQADDPLLEALSVLFYGEKRPATSEELLTMVEPYELVLGFDATSYF